MSASVGRNEQVRSRPDDEESLAELDRDASSPTDGLDPDQVPASEADGALGAENAAGPSGSRGRSGRGTSAPSSPPTGRVDYDYDDDNITIDAHEDRWAWRREIRQRPRQLAVYRVGVGIAGLLLIALGFVTGPIPGPGGIPLVLLGLAIWSSEFEWAHRLMQWFKLQLHHFRQWTRLKQTLFWVLFFSGCGLFGWSYTMIFGIPGWVPQFADNLLQRLPGV